MTTHKMTLKKTLDGGGEHWICPTCNREFILQRTPFRRVDLVMGDQTVPHSAIKEVAGLTPFMDIDDGEPLPDDLQSQIDEIFRNED